MVVWGCSPFASVEKVVTREGTLDGAVLPWPLHTAVWMMQEQPSLSRSWHTLDCNQAVPEERQQNRPRACVCSDPALVLKGNLDFWLVF